MVYLGRRQSDPADVIALVTSSASRRSTSIARKLTAHWTPLRASAKAAIQRGSISATALFMRLPPTSNEPLLFKGSDFLKPISCQLGAHKSFRERA